MTLHIERARSRRPITWLTLIGVLLLPVLRPWRGRVTKVRT